MLAIAILVIFNENPSIQITMLYIIQLLFQSLLIYTKPYKEKMENIKAFVNEILESMTL
jgi:hypothetical protein